MTKMILRHNVATWYDKIQKIVKIYNSSQNSAILDIAPNTVADGADNQDAIVDVNFETNQANHTNSDFKVGDRVRVNILKNNPRLRAQTLNGAARYLRLRRFRVKQLLSTTA